MTSSDDRRLAMVDRLAATPSELEPAWRAAWQTVPRERFVPYYFEPYPDRPGWGIVEDSAQWLEGVYSDAALVTQLDGDDSLAERARTGEAVAGTPTSSSSAPQLMASMLHALDVRDDSRVFEAATGTGYNAALLTERLGDDQVTTVEVDTGLTIAPTPR